MLGTSQDINTTTFVRYAPPWYNSVNQPKSFLWKTIFDICKRTHVHIKLKRFTSVELICIKNWSVSFLSQAKEASFFLLNKINAVWFGERTTKLNLSEAKLALLEQDWMLFNKLKFCIAQLNFVKRKSILLNKIEFCWTKMKFIHKISNVTQTVLYLGHTFVLGHE